MFAVVKTGGKQYRVTPGDVIVVEKIIGETGDNVKLDQILMIDEGEKELKIGSPIVEGVAVNCIVLDQSRTDKILVFKKKRRQGYKRTKGHRQDQTVLIFSMEMSAEQVVRRFISSIANIDLQRLMRGQLQEKDWEGIDLSLIHI